MDVMETVIFHHPLLPRRIAGAAEKYPSMALFLDRLRELRVFTCAKMHENPQTSFSNHSCPFAKDNLACGHLLADDAYYLLDAGITFAEFLSLINSQTARHYITQLDESVDALGNLDSRANLFYRGEAREPTSVASIKAAERELGATLLEMRDRLLELLEPFATVTIDETPPLS